ncbi:MAG: hypothetical protein Q9222_002527 [Ikaeria aurantiellina]
MSRKEKSGTGTVKKVMSSPVQPSPSSPSDSTSSAYSSPEASWFFNTRTSHTRSSSISSLSNAFSTASSKRSPRLQVTPATIESSTANSYDDWLLQPKQTSGFLHGSPPDEDNVALEKEDDNNVSGRPHSRFPAEVKTMIDIMQIKYVSNRLAQAGYTHYKESDILYALHQPYADGDPVKAFNLMQLLKESEDGIIKPYDPNIKLLGAVNREGTTCYLDSLLFAMFAKLGCFEAMLYPNFDDEKKKRLATLLRLWINTLRIGKLITTDITKHIQLQLAECGWKEAALVQQQDASEAFNFLTETLNLPLLTLKVDIFHPGREDAGGDHKIVNERMLEVAVPEEEADGSPITLEHCLETYFNNRIEVKRFLERQKTRGSIRSQASFDSSKGFAMHIETVEGDDSLPSTPLSPLPASVKSPRRPTNTRTRAPSIIQESYISEKGESCDVPDYESLRSSGRRRAGSLRKEVLMPAWQFFSLIPWYTNTQPTSDAQVAAHFATSRPILGICLKRYSFQANGQAVRRNTHIDIPLEIALPHFIHDDNISEDGSTFGNFKLSLQSAVCHRGTRVDQGHYIGLVRTHDPDDPFMDRWMRHDDLSRVRVADVDIDDFLRRETPYLLFYQVVPLDGDPGNIVEGEVSRNSDRPPAYSEHWSDASELELDKKLANGSGAEPSIGPQDAATYGVSEPRTSSSSDQRQSVVFTDTSSNTAGAESQTRTSFDTDGPNTLTASRRSSKANALAIPNGSTNQTETNRLSASMSRLTGRLTRERPESLVGPPIPVPGGPSLEVREVPGTNEKGKLRKEKSKGKLKEHQHLIKGRTKLEKPDRECIVM